MSSVIATSKEETVLIFEVGEKVHIIEQRQLTEDVRRHFVGEIVNCTEHAMRLKGYVWVYDPMKAAFIRKPEKRERVMYLDNRLTIHLIPTEVDLDKIKYVTLPGKGLVVADGEKFTLDISEFTATR